jgi:hypothetical protein
MMRKIVITLALCLKTIPLPGIELILTQILLNEVGFFSKIPIVFTSQ